MRIKRHTRSSGFTLIEMVVVVAIIGIVVGTASFAFKEIENEAYNGASELMGLMKRSRAKALTSTVAYTIRPVTTTRVVATYANSCSETQVNDTSLVLDMPSGARLLDTTWSICYGPRGLSGNSADIIVRDNIRQKTVQVVLGGGVRIL
jgi:prepilin-type N-terminal cleavage/methylation domain-containing protein